MPIGSGPSNKAKIAKRVIEVLEFFDDNHREATVMDIVRRYDRPQSSTSELLSSLVDLGLLYKDAYSRSYSLTPRAALLGTGGQSGPVRDGRLVRLLDRLAAQTGLAVAIFGMVGLNVQVISTRRGARSQEGALLGGAQVPLPQSAAGWLLLSTVSQPRCDGTVRRLIAEAPEDRKFAFADMTATLRKCRDEGFARGPAGFDTKAEVLTVLLPEEEPGHPLAIGFVYNPDNGVKVEALLDCLNEAIRLDLTGGDEPGEIKVLQTAA
ncbi:MAG: helix-turn-helix domain-containing protein [Novosphingobium sp.]